jgi:hypothetical protein
MIENLSPASAVAAPNERRAMVEEQASEAPLCVIVLGMHRSGTSLVAGSLEAAGLALGDVSNVARYNRKGNKENADIRALNARLLLRAGAAWDRPPRAQVPWTEDDRREAADIVRPYLAAGRTWGFKDPRTVWTVEGWLDVLPRAEVVGVVRHPALVAQSLAERSRTPENVQAWLDLWAAYNAELLRLARLLRFPVLHFAPGGPHEPAFWSALAAVCRRFGLSGDPRDFYAPELVHQQESAVAPPPTMAALYDELCALVRTPPARAVE